MDKYIKYFYNIDSNCIRQDNNNYYFSDKYDNLFCLYNISNSFLKFSEIGELKKIYDLINYIDYYNYYCHKIILTRNYEFAAVIKSDTYVLLMYKKNYGPDKKICIFDVNYYLGLNIPFNYHNEKSWKRLWSAKLDYFEYQLNQFGLKHPLLRESFGFYSGLAELAIALQNVVKPSQAYYICHYRLKFDESLFEFYNPLNFVIDKKERDFSEYCKSKFYSIKSSDFNLFVQDILKYFKINQYDNNEVIQVFSRILFECNYFDNYEKIMNNDFDDYNIKNILNYSDNYVLFIKKLYLGIKKSGYYIPLIEWLDNDTVF